MKLKLKQKIIDWVVDSAKRAPYQHLGGYMNRYWFFVCPWVKDANLVNIKKLRSEGLTTRAIAKKLNISKSYVGILIHEL